MTRGGLILMLGTAFLLPLAAPGAGGWTEQAVRGVLWVVLVLASLLGWPS
ncbi:hypothetical protein [Falsiroseomonas tokyonensis]|uniref:Uncharacterized protein n=1 Tax=Falsiroseomonas tokyonensis TaxID=430521 RepID=A0ABV7BY70_9PROT|nr:hypothetical protein [Falsiroseomonas tokyonensis]MBU8540204.1 hypothetical protein [Falsiroseomonas tokyonensis]